MSKRSVQVPLDQERSQAKRKREKTASTASSAARGAETKKLPSRRAAGAAFAAEERPARGAPSRKSTRGSAHRTKAGVTLKGRQELRLNSPGARQTRGA